MATLRQNQFSPRSNTVVSIGTASVAAGSPIDALAGNDRITGIANDATPPFDTGFAFGGIFGVYLEDRLSLSSGHDTLTGLASTAGNQTYVYGIALGFGEGAATLDGGAGHDRITGHAQSRQTSSPSRFLITQLAPRRPPSPSRLVHKYQSDHGAQRHPVPERPLAA